MDDGGDNFDMRGGLCPDLDELVEGVIVLPPAVGVSGGILLDGTYENPGSADDLPPAYCDRENMRVAERDIRCRNPGSVQVRLLDLDGFIRQARSADLLKVLDIHDKAAFDLVVVGDVMKRLELPSLGPLTVIEMHERHLVCQVC